MRVPPTVFADPDHLGRSLATLIADALATAAESGRPFLLGCPGGRSALSTYQALAEQVAGRGLDLRHMVVVMMDEYVERDEVTGALRRIDPALEHSCVRFGQLEIVERLNRAAAPGRGIDADRFWIPDPADPDEFDKRIAEHGGIDLFILASGAGDGHVAFNPAGTRPGTRTRVVELAEQTRRDNLATFPTFENRLDRVPRYGVTVGVGTIQEQSKRAVMVVHGADKATAARRLMAAEHYEPDWPATVLADCANPLLFVDTAAAGQRPAAGAATIVTR
ncbi:6-phosphogluconolactonase [Rugosimonospora africana]|uniref:Glucosamine-6-phosphate deaminase n=1 Tax=Rugosimonospora africana TaxID=556532 RepID=A0A8J3VQX9_9ACTN|nr:6-phosphogluconolactonase [Rugosimonospora africana]GIH15595.1 glucosamine-6-phosphate deaminase [Rugosimonospora africana]